MFTDRRRDSAPICFSGEMAPTTDPDTDKAVTMVCHANICNALFAMTVPFIPLRVCQVGNGCDPRTAWEACGQPKGKPGLQNIRKRGYKLRREHAGRWSSRAPRSSSGGRPTRAPTPCEPARPHSAHVILHAFPEPCTFGGRACSAARDIAVWRRRQRTRRACQHWRSVPWALRESRHRPMRSEKSPFGANGSKLYMYVYIVF